MNLYFVLSIRYRIPYFHYCKILETWYMWELNINWLSIIFLFLKKKKLEKKWHTYLILLQVMTHRFTCFLLILSCTSFPLIYPNKNSEEKKKVLVKKRCFNITLGNTSLAPIQNHTSKYITCIKRRVNSIGLQPWFLLLMTWYLGSLASS